MNREQYELERSHIYHAIDRGIPVRVMSLGWVKWVVLGAVAVGFFGSVIM